MLKCFAMKNKNNEELPLNKPKSPINNRETEQRIRMKKFLKYANTNQGKFEEDCNLGNGFVSKIAGSFHPGSKQKIGLVYPDLNLNWVITGEGTMLHSQSGESEFEYANSLIPLLPISAQGGSLNDFLSSVRKSECELVISPIKGADFAITVAGESMAPEFPSGSQVLIKKIDETAFIEWGKAYVLDTCNGTVVKEIIPSDKDDYLCCQSINSHPKFASFDVCKKDIYGIYRVMMCMALK